MLALAERKYKMEMCFFLPCFNLLQDPSDFESYPDFLKYEINPPEVTQANLHVRLLFFFYFFSQENLPDIRESICEMRRHFKKWGDLIFWIIS